MFRNLRLIGSQPIKNNTRRFVSSSSLSSFPAAASSLQGVEIESPLQKPTGAGGVLQGLQSKISIKGEAFAGRPAYLDLQATTPMDPRVLDAMLPWQLNEYGNPHSRTHQFGWIAEEAVEKARSQVASLIKADPKEIIFTSGATESNNLAIKGVAHFYGKKKKHIITLQTEHKCVLDSCRILEQEGFEVTYLPVKNDGLVSLDELKSKIRPTTALVGRLLLFFFFY